MMYQPSMQHRGRDFRTQKSQAICRHCKEMSFAYDWTDKGYGWSTSNIPTHGREQILSNREPNGSLCYPVIGYYCPKISILIVF